MAEGTDIRTRRKDGFTSLFPYVSRETRDRLALYESLLRQWQPAVNLVSPSTLDHVWHRHFADSAQLLSLAPASAKTWLDLGSGAGFPGLVIAIMLAASSPSLRERHAEGVPPARREGRGEGPGLAPSPEPAPHPNPLPVRGRGEGTASRDGRAPRVTLIESDTRKAAFLREVIRHTQAPAAVIAERIEKAATQFTVRPMDVVTARALAPLPRLLGLAWPAFGAGTVGLFLKGRSAEDEIAEARERWVFAHELVPSLTDPDGRIVVIRELTARTEG